MSERSDQILQAARDLLLAGGPQGFSLRKVAAQVGLSAPAIYRHYASKDALIQRVIAEGHRVFGGYLFQALEAPDPLARMQRAGDLYLSFAFEQPEYYRLIFLSWDRLDAPRHATSKPGDVAPTFQFVLDRVAECQAAGLLPERSKGPFELALLLWSQSHGLATLWLTGGAQLQMDREHFRLLARSILARTLKGLELQARRPAR